MNQSVDFSGVFHIFISQIQRCLGRPGEFPVPDISTAAMEPPPLEAVAPPAPDPPEAPAPDPAPVAVQVVKLPVTRHGDVVVGRSKFGRKGTMIFQHIASYIIIYHHISMSYVILCLY